MTSQDPWTTESDFSDTNWDYKITKFFIQLKNTIPILIEYHTESAPACPSIHQLCPTLPDIAHANGGFHTKLIVFGHPNNPVALTPILNPDLDCPLVLKVSGNTCTYIPPGNLKIIITFIKCVKMDFLNYVVGQELKTLPLPDVCNQEFSGITTCAPNLEICSPCLVNYPRENMTVATALCPFELPKQCAMRTTPHHLTSHMAGITHTEGTVRIFFYEGVPAEPNSVLVSFLPMSLISFYRNPCPGILFPDVTLDSVPLVYMGQKIRLLPLETVQLSYNNRYVTCDTGIMAIVYDHGLNEDICIAPTPWAPQKKCTITLSNKTSAVKLISPGYHLANAIFFKWSTETSKRVSLIKMLSRPTHGTVPLFQGICIDTDIPLK
ncbi:hypothetical protein RHVP.11 [Cricetid gammaherpesvirus 2]|uniref:Uncharacterized protein n=1 Tax=Cricetid gammaherpesvirus 2 TaxID=1605972 RepID=E9M5J8_9GAMA|nr:hypothetical protein RHVP.11 [Cricetid gammaherpesvirus 2]ADW24356.1 hypothetical protein RHVP.11 [Cricetid gammaherpesvirus 2]ADW24438.1 hypothetical protein RHVP-L.11 [Cricetid gammaherpesvirus 2]